MPIKLIFLLILSYSCTNQPPNLGLKDNMLRPCPKTPNCVSTFDQQKDKSIDPIKYQVSKEYTYNKLLNILSSMKGSEVKNKQANYLHAEFKSSIFGFVDDVEIYFDDTNQVVHLKSSSRTGYYDFGVNKKRAYDIYFTFAQSK